MAYQPTAYTSRQLELNWININIHLHDQICSCNKPIDHLINTIASTGGITTLTKETKNKIQKCLGETSTETTEETTGHLDAVDILDEGDLDALFEGDLTEDDDG